MRKAVYTAITGDYDDLKPIAHRTPGWDYVCFTDGETVRSRRLAGWWIVPVKAADTAPRLDAVRRSRHYKILVHRHLPDHDLTLWHDASMEIRVDLDEFARRFAPGGEELALMGHPKRKCTYREAAACILEERDDVDTVAVQMLRYQVEGYPRGRGLYYGGLLLRRRTPAVRALMELWWREVVHESRRDQLSFDYALWKHGPLDMCVHPYDRRILQHEFRRCDHPPRAERSAPRTSS